MRAACIAAAIALVLAGAWAVAADQPAGPPSPSPAPVAAAKPRELTADDLQNLVVCARRTLPTLTADEMQAVAASIKHAEDDLAAMRAASAKEAPPDKKP